MARAMRIISIIVLIVLTVVAMMSVWLLYPPRPAVDTADAVLVIAGAPDGRHERGAELVEEGVSENFVVSNPGGAGDEVGYAHCHGEDRPASAEGFWCMDPVPSSTAGEALTVADLAESEGWSSLVAVTSRTHARRVQTMLNRCTDLDAVVVTVGNRYPDLVPTQIAREIGGYLKFWATNPC